MYLILYEWLLWSIVSGEQLIKSEIHWLVLSVWTSVSAKGIVRAALTMLLSDASQYNKDDCDLNIVHTSFGTNKTGSSQTVHRHSRGWGGWCQWRHKGLHYMVTQSQHHRYTFLSVWLYGLDRSHFFIHSLGGETWRLKGHAVPEYVYIFHHVLRTSRGALMLRADVATMTC